MNPTLPPFVQELLDRRVDPLDDARTEEWLFAHPEALASFAALRSSLRSSLADLPGQRAPQHARRWHPVGWLLAAAAAALIVIAAASDDDARAEATRPPTSTSSTTPSNTTSLPTPDFASTGGVVRCVSFATEFTTDKARQKVFSNHARRSVEHYRCPTAADTRYVHAKTVQQEIVRP